MAIGIGRMFGFQLLENFNSPYLARSMRDFWRRWHISLSTWFRDYLYIPLGGSRKGEGRTWPKNAFPSLRTNPKETGRLLVFSDSFGYHLLTFLPLHFNKVAFFQMYASKANMAALIEEFKPDVILEVHLERMLDKFIQTDYYLD